MLLLARDARFMGEHAIGRSLLLGGWLTMLVVSAAGVLHLWQQLSGQRT